ncbi:pollen receptor-like kinase 5 [Apium graveolens]|uniref:pollen receptor-like kinase 5 n=1 Tax=Apium graveolens TaxID=4045 RepID=UPI003D7B6E1A
MRWTIVLHVLLMCVIVGSSDDSEAEILLDFKKSLSNVGALQDWDEDVSLCTGDKANWNGLLCAKDNFYGLRLESMGLSGIINFESLSKLPYLRTISFMNNNFNGPFPANINKLSSLRAIYLSNNNFSGEIPGDSFKDMNAMRRVYLGNNDFSGKIPNSLAGLSKLVELQVQDNKFVGRIPDFKQKDLIANFSNNKLEGPIPSVLSKESSSSFAGNNLCGKPMGNCPPSKKKSFPKVAIIVAAAGAIALAVTVITTLLLHRRNRRKNKASNFKKTSGKTENKVIQTKYNYDQRKEAGLPKHTTDNNTKAEHAGKLHFVKNDTERFELQDLLRASAEVLGSGSSGSSYKAILLSGPAVVVKRYKQMSNVGKADFYEHMRNLGSLSHPNLLPLVAFYYNKEEKLLINDFAENGSLASHLHSNLKPNQPGLDWPTRLRIIKGVGKGLDCLYKAFPNLPLPHGHLKSSNVLLDRTFEPLLADYGLIPVLNKEHAYQFMVAYKSPESAQNDHVLTRKTDVWCLGILVLEMLTGKFPANYLKQGKGRNADLASWVNSVVREEWTGEVFDNNMKRSKNAEGEMLKLLKIGMFCCEWDVDRRWDLNEALAKINELKERNGDDDQSSYASEGDAYSSRGMTDDEFTFSVNG